MLDTLRSVLAEISLDADAMDGDWLDAHVSSGRLHAPDCGEGRPSPLVALTAAADVPVHGCVLAARDELRVSYYLLRALRLVAGDRSIRRNLGAPAPSDPVSAARWVDGTAIMAESIRPMLRDEPLAPAVTSCLENLEALGRRLRSLLRDELRAATTAPFSSGPGVSQAAILTVSDLSPSLQADGLTALVHAHTLAALGRSLLVHLPYDVLVTVTPLLTGRGSWSAPVDVSDLSDEALDLAAGLWDPADALYSDLEVLTRTARTL